MRIYAIRSGNKIVKVAIHPSWKLAKCLMHPASFCYTLPWGTASDAMTSVYRACVCEWATFFA